MNLMNLLHLLTNHGAADVLDILAGAALRATCLVLLAYIFIRLLRHSSAAMRHWLWLVVLYGTVLLPLVGLISPAWRMSILPAAAGSTPVDNPTPITQNLKASPLPSQTNSILGSNAQAAKLAAAESAGGSGNNQKIEHQPPTPPKVSVGPNTIPTLPWAQAGLLLWLSGVLVTLNRWRGQWQEIRQINHNSTTVTDLGWRALLDDLANHYGLRCHIQLLYSDQVAVPMTWGSWRPVILLPGEALEWPLARRRVVLLHELAHIARWDYLNQCLVLVVCALYWFNPVIWWTARQIMLERERASDDSVLNSGIKRIEYATHLVEIASSARRNPRQGALGLALTRHSALTDRVSSILSVRTSRRKLAYHNRLALVGLIMLLLWPLSTVQLVPVPAQTGVQPVVLTIALPTNLKDTFNDSILKDFQAANPGIQVHVTDPQNVASAAFGFDAHITDLQKYASSADVLYIGGNGDPQVTAQATRAGMFLDLTPLVSADNALKIDDFIPAMWRSFQWDNGLWAIPVNGDPYVLFYKPAAFDKAGLTYPASTWTAADFLKAVTQLTVKDAQGQVITPGFATTGGFSRAVMLRALAAANLFDTNSVPNPPALDQPNVEAALNTFSQMQSDGLIGEGDAAAGAMSFEPIDLFLYGSNNDQYSVALLPGGAAYLQANAFAVSAGTQNPDAAYALIKFLSFRPEFATEGGLPARRSLAALTAIKFPPDIQAIIDKGMANAITAADMRFADYLRIANNNVGQSMNAHTAIVNAQSQATSDANLSAAKKGTLVLTINEPTVAALPAGKIALNFDISARINPIPTQAQWNQFIANFVAHDPLVASVNLTISDHSVSQAASHADCFFLGYNAVPELNESSVLNLDPYLTADPSFDKGDLLGSTLAAVQRDNKTWALPLTVSPLVLVYDTDKFKTANVPAPGGDWTVSAFHDALTHLKAISNPNDPNTTAPFVGAGDGTPLMTLIADYGGLPIDYRTAVPTINFTDPANVSAIRQVLDLVKNGQIAYGALGNLFGGSGGQNWNQTTAIFNFDLNTLDSLQGNPKGRSLLPKNPQVTLFPVGQETTGVAYDVGAAYISATAQNSDACYRFIRALADHPELFWNMPARSSLLNGTLYKSIVASNTLALYQQFATRLNSPHTIPFPISISESNAISLLFPQHWLFEAFDNYVLHNGDLEAALAMADHQANGYLACTANLPVLNVKDIGPATYNLVKPYASCAETMEPALKALFVPLIGS